MAFREGEELNSLTDYRVFEFEVTSSIPKGEYMGCIVVTAPSKDLLVFSNWTTYDCKRFQIA